MWTQNYFAILPSSVRYDTRLKPEAKLLYATLYSLAQSDGVVYASNKYLAQTAHCSPRTVIRYINDLVSFGHIDYKYEYKPGSKEIARRLLYITCTPPLIELAAGQAYAAVIPSHVLVEDISAMAKLLYAEISAATPTDGYCTKSSAEFAALLKAGEPTVRRWLKELTDSELVRAEMEYREGGRRIKRRRLYLTEIMQRSPVQPKIEAEPQKAVESGNESSEDNVANSPISARISNMLKIDTTPDNANAPNARLLERRNRKLAKKLKKTVAALL